MATITKVTPDDTATVFIGSRALESWYWTGLQIDGVQYPVNADDWTVTGIIHDELGEPTEERFTLNHKVLMRTVRRIVAGKIDDLSTDGITARECRTLLFRGASETDFDAVTADRVMQAAVYGEVRFPP